MRVVHDDFRGPAGQRALDGGVQLAQQQPAGGCGLRPVADALLPVDDSGRVPSMSVDRNTFISAA